MDKDKKIEELAMNIEELRGIAQKYPVDTANDLVAIYREIRKNVMEIAELQK